MAAKRISAAMDVRKSGENPPAGSLSGGNLQKFIVGRELDRQPAVLIVNQPTWGRRCRGRRAASARLWSISPNPVRPFWSSARTSTRFSRLRTEIAVISEGKLSDIYPASDLSREKIGLLMGGMYGKTETAETAHAH